MDNKWPNLDVMKDTLVAERMFLTLWRLGFLPPNIDLSRSENLMYYLHTVHKSKYINKVKRQAAK